MSDKNKAKSISISPESARQVDFTSQTTNFKELLDKETNLLERDEEIRESIQKLFEPYGDSDENLLVYGGVASTTYVYKKHGSSEDVKQLANTYGNAVWSLISQSQAAKMLTKVIGEEAVNKLKQVAECYNGVKEVDEKATKKLREELSVLLKEQSQINRQLETIASKKSKSREYVSYVKDVASIAASAKDLG